MDSFPGRRYPDCIVRKPADHQPVQGCYREGCMCVSPADNQLLGIRLRTGRGPLTFHWEGSFCLWWRRHANTFLHLQLEVSNQDCQSLMDLLDLRSSANPNRKSAASSRSLDTSDQDCHCAVDKLLSAFNNCKSAAPTRTLALQAGNTSQSPYRWIDSYGYMQQHTCDVNTMHYVADRTPCLWLLITLYSVADERHILSVSLAL